MMFAFPYDIFHFQETNKDRGGAAALLNRLRSKGFQCAAAPSALKNEGISAGVLAAVRKSADAQLPAGKDKDGIASDPRCPWSRIRFAGWSRLS